MQHQNGVIRRTMPSGTAPVEVDVVVDVEGEEEEAGAIDMASSTKSAFSRNCVLGCHVNKLALCRFPVHDPKRLNSWLKFFDISLERVDSIGGAANLRVCLKHFNQKQQMAKTRIKTTPTRLQKVALAATTKTATLAPPPTTTTSIEKPTAAATPITTATTNNNTAVQELKRQINGDHLSNKTRSQSNASTIIVAAPKRTTSVSSATSTLSQISNDSQSDTDSTIATIITTIPTPSPPPPPPTPPAETAECPDISEQKISHETNNENNNNNNNNNNIKSIALLNKLSSNGKRKVYMITEKSAEYTSNESAKRKMYLIMEDQNGVDKDGDGGAMTSLHMSNQTTTDNNNKRKKLTFYTDNINSELCTQKFEQILPEILNRIQQQNGVAQQQMTTNGIDAAMQEQQQPQQEEEPEEKVPITLPPKKNRMKIERNAQEDIVARNCARRDEHTSGECDVRNAAIAAANTPVIVSNVHANGARAGNNNHNNNTADAVLTTISNRSNGKKSAQHTEKQINLSSDFLFLMKMLPKLESIPEPQKQQVKQCIESFIEQSAGGNHEPPEY